MKDQWTPKQISQPRCCLPVCGLANLACLAVLSCCGGLDRWMLLVLVLQLVGRPRRLLRHPQSSHSTVVPCILGRAVVPPKRPYDCYASTIWLSSLPPNTQGFNEGSRMEWEAWHRPACACVRNTTHNPRTPGQSPYLAPSRSIEGSAAAGWDQRCSYLAAAGGLVLISGQVSGPCGSADTGFELGRGRGRRRRRGRGCGDMEWTRPWSVVREGAAPTGLKTGTPGHPLSSAKYHTTRTPRFVAAVPTAGACPRYLQSGSSVDSSSVTLVRINHTFAVYRTRVSEG
ncbi:hypothetical protein BGZ61DRAFT_474207 [Ilyonectria robusta]|uniref:uncharacterized protein n=1 Tax=Ilyonectria robusta TaxID=1079257 RepID=UPI001E8DD1F7|nr:uncharacterized protein BGZ61DRAFT_474207 [Ilyonectria robusta]KAH8733530.1 hypothetical protein BGZ61DRAFT_474207 [Ilyonectria robusta]